MDSLLFVFFIFLHLSSPAAADLAADGAALLSFRSAVGRAALPWNASVSPCGWKGVTCSGDRVATLRLPGLGLAGRIPAGTIGNLSELRVISLRYNALSGPLPADLARCTRLRLIYLKRNQFSGEFPSFLSSLAGLTRLNLAENNFSGEIPSSLNNLTHLIALYLENNDFSGEMPDLEIPKLEQFNVSFNHLTGSVPAKLRGMLADSFLGMPMCGGPLKSCPGDASPSPANSSNLSSKNRLVFIAGAPRVFDLEGLLRASAEVLGKGSSGIAYKAEMEADLAAVVVVKRFRDLKVGEKEFVKKIEAIGAVKHPNLVPLLAYYYSKEEKLLVYDYIPNGNLHSLLHGETGAGESPLSWENRVNIALDAARGIEYIHSISPSSSHGNIKSSNILITSSFGARISDHGIAHFFPSSAASNLAGGYLAPEAITAQSITPKADVFSFGVVLLELVTGKAPDLEKLAGGGVGLPQWVEPVIRGGWTGELFDTELVRLRSPEEEMIMLLQVGVDCSSELPGNRPAMAAVVARIEGIRRSAALRKEMLDEGSYR
ncbi:putative inactive receptor kinase [Platanthera zijinensis]|uniref:Inactive receptor kinase n=1 Tax=Platanthera zijinensis TaxID=2320716 RepID=A0AAP0FXP3_9ASPA